MLQAVDYLKRRLEVVLMSIFFRIEHLSSRFRLCAGRVEENIFFRGS